MNSGLPWSPGLWQGVGALVIDPQNSNTLYATMAGKVFRSTDGAASWSEVNANLPVSFVSTLMRVKTYLTNHVASGKLRTYDDEKVGTLPQSELQRKTMALQGHSSRR